MIGDNKIKTVSLRINDKCNFRCKYCFTHLQNPENREMSMETADDIMKYCMINGITEINIPQKEPMASWDVLSHIINMYSQNGIKIKGITTNSYIMPIDAIKLFKEHNMHILCSFDGLWQDLNRRTANGGRTSAIVEKNLYALKGAGVNFGIACAITHETAGEIYENYQYLKEITPSIAFNFDTSSENALDKTDLTHISKAFKRIAKHSLNVFPLNKLQQRVQSKSRYTNFMCGAGRGSYTIDYDGTFYPCYHAPAWKQMNICLGNIYDGLDITEKSKFRQYDTKTPEKCKKCPVGLCGICYVNSYDVMGDMLTPIPINCEIFKILTKIVKQQLGGKSLRQRHNGGI